MPLSSPESVDALTARLHQDLQLLNHMGAQFLYIDPPEGWSYLEDEEGLCVAAADLPDDQRKLWVDQKGTGRSWRVTIGAADFMGNEAEIRAVNQEAFDSLRGEEVTDPIEKAKKLYMKSGLVVPQFAGYFALAGVAPVTPGRTLGMYNPSK